MADTFTAQQVCRICGIDCPNGPAKGLTTTDRASNTSTMTIQHRKLIQAASTQQPLQ